MKERVVCNHAYSEQKPYIKAALESRVFVAAVYSGISLSLFTLFVKQCTRIKL
jgi:hypothetical protein